MRDERERWTLIGFFFRHQVNPKSGNTHFLVMSTSIVQRVLRRGVTRFVSPRRFHTEPRPLETSEDWTDFQLERANYKRLSEYRPPRSPHSLTPSSQSTTSPPLGQPRQGRILSNHIMASTVLLLPHNSLCPLSLPLAHTSDTPSLS